MPLIFNFSRLCVCIWRCGRSAAVRRVSDAHCCRSNCQSCYPSCCYRSNCCRKPWYLLLLMKNEATSHRSGRNRARRAGCAAVSADKAGVTLCKTSHAVGGQHSTGESVHRRWATHSRKRHRGTRQLVPTGSRWNADVAKLPTGALYYINAVVPHRDQIHDAVGLSRS